MALNTARLPRQDLVDLTLDLRMGLLGWLGNRGWEAPLAALPTVYR
jgi:hypothetical protein